MEIVEYGSSFLTSMKFFKYKSHLILVLFEYGTLHKSDLAEECAYNIRNVLQALSLKLYKNFERWVLIPHMLGSEDMEDLRSFAKIIGFESRSHYNSFSFHSEWKM